jgi:hypothetical protein
MGRPPLAAEQIETGLRSTDTRTEDRQSVWGNGSPSRSVNEEAPYEFLPLFTSLRRPFLKGWPGQEQHAIRINLMPGGTETSSGSSDLPSTSMNSGARPTSHDLPPTIE